MAYGRSRKSTTYGEFWPGYVDVLSTLLLVVTFLMSVFMVSQFYVSQEASGKDTALRRLTRQIAEITNLLSMEKGKGKSLEDELSSLQASLATLRSDGSDCVLPPSKFGWSSRIGRIMIFRLMLVIRVASCCPCTPPGIRGDRLPSLSYGCKIARTRSCGSEIADVSHAELSIR